MVSRSAFSFREYRPTVAVPAMTPSEVYAISRSVYHVLQRGGYGLRVGLRLLMYFFRTLQI